MLQSLLIRPPSTWWQQNLRTEIFLKRMAKALSKTSNLRQNKAIFEQQPHHSNEFHLWGRLLQQRRQKEGDQLCSENNGENDEMVIMSHAKDMWKGEHQKFKICVKENETLYQNDSRLNVMRKKKRAGVVFFNKNKESPHEAKW